MQVRIHFPKQKQDFKEASRMIRSNAIFRDFVTGKTKDRRYLTLEFPEEKAEVLLGILESALQKLKYKYEKDITPTS